MFCLGKGYMAELALVRAEAENMGESVAGEK